MILMLWQNNGNLADVNRHANGHANAFKSQRCSGETAKLLENK